MHGEMVSTWHELHTIPANNGRVLILPMTSKRLSVFGPSETGGYQDLLLYGGKVHHRSRVQKLRRLWTGVWVWTVVKGFGHEYKGRSSDPRLHVKASGHVSCCSSSTRRQGRRFPGRASRSSPTAPDLGSTERPCLKQ